jgi:hypothetical protein
MEVETNSATHGRESLQRQCGAEMTALELSTIT